MILELSSVAPSVGDQDKNIFCGSTTHKVLQFGQHAVAQVLLL